MNKLFFGLTFIIVFTIASIYTLLFTKFGNSYIASYIENKVNDEQNEVKLKINDFTLTFNTININATIDDNSNIDISGDLQLFKKIVDIKYDIQVKDLANLEKLIGQKLNGPFFTKGIFKGNQQLSTIEGISDIANSETQYKVNLTNFEPKNINFEVKNAKIDKLLELLNQPIYAKGTLDIKGDIKNATLGQLDGTITSNIIRADIIKDVINKEFKQNINSNISFSSDLNAKLIGNNIELDSSIISSILDVFTEKSIINLQTNELNSDYKLDVKNLTKLEGIIGKKLNGNFIVNGNLAIKDKEIKVNGTSNIFESTTSYNLLLENSVLKDIDFKVENGKIDKLLHMLNEPVYSVGDFVVVGKISSSKDNILLGNIDTNITNGKLINEVVNTVFKQNIKDTVSFDSSIKTNIENNSAISKVNLNSSLGTLTTKETIFTFKDASLSSDYLLSIASLEKLKDITGAKMRGKLDINGTFKNKDKSMFVDGTSSLLGGTLNFDLKNNNLNATLKDAQIKQLTYMLYYPETFDSKTDLNLTYDTLLKKGKLTGNLLNGHFLPNNFSTLINQLAKFDLTREIYETVDINSDINNMIVNSTINMKSKNTTIDVTSSTLDLEKSIIDAKILGKIKTTEFGVNVNGATSNPKISLDTKGLLENQINKQIDKNQDKIKEKLDKVLKGKLGEEGSENIIKNIKSLF